LADALIGRRFIATTRKDKNDYTRIDGKGEFYRVMPSEAGPDTSAPVRVDTEVEDGFDDIPV
jgi:hypothetical protein